MSDIPLKVLHAKKLADCAGCRNNFYNYGEQSGCWSLPRAKMVYRWQINMWTPMDRRDRFIRVRVFNCYHGEGNQRDIYLERLPEHLGGEWADKREKVASELAALEAREVQQ